jgi:uncharacterized membrane protein
VNWTIADLKKCGLAAFKGNYWHCVAVALIACFVSGNGCRFSFHEPGFRPWDSSSSITVSEEPREADAVGEASSAATLFRYLFVGGSRREISGSPAIRLGLYDVLELVLMIVALLVRFLLLNPLRVGCNNFFLRNTASNAPFGAVGAPFRTWKRVVGTMFLRDLLLFLWMLLPAALVVAVLYCSYGTVLDTFRPGGGDLEGYEFLNPLMVVPLIATIPFVVKTYSYRLVPYLLADDPALSGHAAIARSRELMQGQKWHAVLLDFSFIGWIFLSVLTLGLLWVFRVCPWMHATEAELYRALVPHTAAEPPPLPGAAET